MSKVKYINKVIVVVKLRKLDVLLVATEIAEVLLKFLPLIFALSSIL
jgi:hypothetical protein